MPSSNTARSERNTGADRSHHDLACVRCGYNLRGLAVTGVCPECGTLVSLSMDRVGLCGTPPEWRRRVGRGLGLLQFSLGAILLIAFLFIGAFGIDSYVHWSEWLPIGDIALYGSIAVGIGAPIAGCIGVFWLTSPEPAEVFDRSCHRSRPRTRAAAIAIMVVILLIVFTRMAGGVLFVTAETVLWICGAFLLGTLGFNFSRWLAMMFRRAKPEMVGWAGIASTLTLTFTILLTVYAICLGVVRSYGYNSFLSNLVGVLVVSLLGLGLSSLALLLVLMRTLRLELRQTLRVATELPEESNGAV